MSQNELVILENDELISISNNIINLEFFKQKGLYNIIFKSNGHKCALNNCYIAINYIEFEKVVEFSSIGLEFKTFQKNIKDEIGSSIQIILEPTDTRLSMRICNLINPIH